MPEEEIKAPEPDFSALENSELYEFLVKIAEREKISFETTKELIEKAPRGFNLDDLKIFGELMRKVFS